MLAELETLTSRTIPNEILFEASTIRQLTKKLHEQGHLNQRPKTLIPLNSSGSRPPLFFFNDDFNGRGYWIITLARLLGSDQPLLIVAPLGDGNEPVPHTIEAMAADRLPLILDAQTAGPYRLCGSCSAAIVAFEVARLLIAAGKTVEMVVMLDPPTISASRAVQLLFSAVKLVRPITGPIVDCAWTWMFLRCARLQKLCTISWARRRAAVVRRVRRLAGGVETPNFEQSDAERFARTLTAMSNYSPKPLAVRVIYFSIDFSARPWRRISSDLEIIKSPGSHGQVDIADIAKHLRARLQRTSLERQSGT
jgi:thioesterase domain-containing protein